MNTYTEDDLRTALARDADADRVAVDVWPQLHRRIVVRRRVRAGVVGAAAVAATVAVLLAWPTTRDSVHVSPAHPHGAATILVPERSLSHDELTASVDILRQRLDLLGVSGATIETRDGDIEVSAPHVGSAELAAIAVPGVFQVRPVEQVAPSGGGGCPSTSAAAVVCAADGTQYTVGPVALDHGDVQGAEPVRSTIDNTWTVALTFNQTGAQRFYTLTKAAAGRPALDGNCRPPRGCNAIAMVVDGTVLSAPSVQPHGGIRGGQTQITGMSGQQARTLAAVLSNPPLPVSFRVD